MSLLCKIRQCQEFFCFISINGAGIYSDVYCTHIHEEFIYLLTNAYRYADVYKYILLYSLFLSDQ